MCQRGDDTFIDLLNNDLLNFRVMLTINVDLSDRLVYGQMGTVKHISKNLNGEVT